MTDNEEREKQIREAGWADSNEYEVVYRTQRDFRWPDYAHIGDIVKKSFWETLPNRPMI